VSDAPPRPVVDGPPIDPAASSRHRAARLSAVAGAAFLALAALSSFLPGGGQGGGSPSSSYSNQPEGTSAWAELLGRFGDHVERLRGDLDPSGLDPAATVVVLDAPGLTAAQAGDLGRFVRRGGRLVAGGDGTAGWLGAILTRPPDQTDAGIQTAAPAAGSSASEVEGLRAVRAGGLSSWSQAGQLEPILVGERGRILAVAGDIGSGRVVALADPSPVQNILLAADDNAAFAVDLVGPPGRTVLFAEGAHGYGEGEGLAALPRRWRLTLAGLGLAAGVWLVARSRRLGPPEEEARSLPPPRWAYVEALAGTLARTRRPHEAAEPVRRRARELIAGRAGLPPDAGADELYRAAVGLGLPEDEAAAAAGSGATDDAAVLAAGRALARLGGGAAHR
jgi:hypothetical protein